MRRRTLFKSLLVAGAGVVASGFRLPLVHAADYRGKFFVFVQADGGWDPTSFCDPKTNTPGEPVINHWAERDEVRQAGNIAYAPFARNRTFFEKYHRRMLVINGWMRRRTRIPSASCTTGAVATPRGTRPDGSTRRALRASVAGTLLELRGILRDLRYHSLHAYR